MVKKSTAVLVPNCFYIRILEKAGMMYDSDCLIFDKKAVLQRKNKYATERGIIQQRIQKVCA